MSGIDLQQNLSQQQTLSPQLRQSLDILQANSLELSQVLQQILATNPVIELESQDQPLPSEMEDSPADAETDSERLDNLADDYREAQILTNANQGPSQETVDYLYNNIVAPKTLQQHLINQLEQEKNSAQIHQAALEIISSIDDRGFLDQPVETIAITSKHPLETLEKALVKIQHLDPPGVGASDLTESLLIQLQRLGMTGSIESQIVENHLKNLALKKIPQIAKELSITTERIAQAAEFISTLTPDPGATFDPTYNPYIAPDLYIEHAEHGWTARLSNERIPHITISNQYKDLMANTRDNKARTYLRDQIKEGKTILRAVSQRQETLLKIAEIIILKQHAFLQHGTAKLKPLRMSEVADLIEVHHATISRAVAGKYAMTPHGLIELRQFFSTGFESADGTQVANTSIKETIQTLVNQEPEDKPLSDSSIEKLLQEKGLKVARRTIAKYREQLGILPSHLRKKY